MKREDDLVKLFYFHVPAAMILSGQINTQEFPQHELEELMRSYHKEYSETEVRLMYQRIKEASVRRHGVLESDLNVFSVLIHVAEDLLIIDNNEVRCRYSELQRWRDVSRYLGEEIFVCAFLARRFQEQGIRTSNFCWNTVLGHTNRQLNLIMQEGISENHFHLFGSAPVFQLAWIKLMNDVNTSRYKKGLDEIDRNKRNQHVHFDLGYKEDSVECMVLQAALMRAVMYICLNDRSQLSEMSSICRFLKSLKSGSQILQKQPEIRSIVNLLKAEAMMSRGKGIPDYALESAADHSSENVIFAGERKLIYEMLCDILVFRRLPEEVRGLLYPYLVIRTAVRGALVQNNDTIGFENFSVYSSQKNAFLFDRKDTERMAKHAVWSSFQSEHLRSLEIRITPQNDYVENARWIRYFDRIFLEQLSLSSEQFYYVYHFPKQADKNIMPIFSSIVDCRHHELRRKIRRMGNGILLFRRRMPQEASRLRGIDACSQEIGCRPEVFASVFRQLRNQVITDDTFDVKQLRISYHVGEDFIDMADGLRAIDEAIRFLCLRNGDRLGHATVLGYNADLWYERKHGIITIPMQDYLDNIVWMYHKLLEFRIGGCEMLKDYLLKEYSAYYYQIYENGRFDAVKSDIFTYYEAWKLRGDLPELYRTGRYKQERMIAEAQSLENPEYPENQGIRKNQKVARLYYEYHFDAGVRSNGMKTVEIQIPSMYIEAVKKIQISMQWYVAEKGIGIEANPSSNLAISNMMNYAEHPIMNLYNLGLDYKANKNCAQMFVSINTDDKGVFHTSLENEYALMASALENMVDEEGRRLYSPQEVYDWVDRIRKMGNRQSF